MKKRTLEFNLAELDTTKLTALLSDNGAGIPEVMALLEGLFDMWTTALQASRTAVTYGETLHPEFLEMFVAHTSHNHGITPERLRDILNMVKQQKTTVSPSTKIH